jgi:CRP-like cAMP-binding protein
LDLITLTAISISIASLILVIVTSVLLRRQVTGTHHTETHADPLEVSAIVSEFTQRLRRLEESLIDQKVKLEILELRAQRAAGQGASFEIKSPEPTLERQKVSPLAQQQAFAYRDTPSFEAITSESVAIASSRSEKRSGSTEREALKLVLEGRGRTTAKDIQEKISRTREHTARMMNGLFQEGYVDRDATVRPFAYSITQKGRELLNS